MFAAFECRAIALQKFAQAKHDKRHRRELTSAEAWLFLAQKLDEVEGVVAVAYEADDDAAVDYRAAQRRSRALPSSRPWNRRPFDNDTPCGAC
jgi:hypothetical protein